MSDEPIEIPIESELDLHAFAPADVLSVVSEYLEAAAARGLREVRLVHGRGRGIQRAAVQAALERHPLVEEFWDDPAAHFGATLARLRATDRLEPRRAVRRLPDEAPRPAHPQTNRPNDHASVMLISILRTARERPLFVLLAVLLAAIEIVARMRGGPPPSLALFRNPFAAIAAATVFCRYVIEDRRGPTRKWIVYLSPVTYVMAAVVEGGSAPRQLRLLDTLSALGALGVLGFLAAAVNADSARNRERYIERLTTALIVPMAASMASFGLWSTSAINPVYDGRVYAFEEILGVKFSLLGVQTYRLLPAFSAIATGCYSLLPLAVALIAAAQKDTRAEHEVLMATVFAGAAGFALYFFCPVAGPLHAFKSTYPDALPAISANGPLITAPLGPPRNGMPSLHTAWALLLWFNCRQLGAMWQWALRAFVALTLWAVMGLDDTHWFLDVVVAVPFAVALQLAFVTGVAQTSRRGIDLGICSVLVLVWLVGLRTGTPLLSLPPVLAWTAVVATVWWPLSRERAATQTGELSRSRIAVAKGPTVDHLPA